MKLFKNLIDFYDTQINDKNSTLPPLYHTVKSVSKKDFVIKIDENGDFVDAYELGKKKSVLIPVTKESLKRTNDSKKKMHAIFDKLQYFNFEENKQGMEKYIKNLENWCASEYRHPKVEALLNYIKGGSVNVDIQSKGFASNKDCFLLFEVISHENKDLSKNDENSDILWENKVIRRKYADYYENCVLSETKEKEICYITGEKDTSTKEFFGFCGNLKLISANDSKNFTYRGRFTDGDEALNIGMHANQKFSISLKWLIKNQSLTIGESAVILWENKVFAGKVCNRPWGNILVLEESNSESYSTGNKVYLNDFMKAIKALKVPRKDLKNGVANMNILILDAPCDGRMAIKYYREMSTEEYLDNILKWHEKGSWKHYIKKDKNSEKIFFEGMPSVLDIVKYAYGNERESGFIDIEKNKFFGARVANLLPCIIEGKNFPESIIRQLVYKASNRQCYEKYNNWQYVLRAACSCVKKYLFDKNKEEYKMALDENITDRNYLYGRLLAVADRIEISAQYKKSNEVKETNAGRYMSVFSQRPFKIWQTIEERIQPYLVSLDSKKTYSDLLNKIHSKFKFEDYENNNKLSGLYLLGYHCQMMALDPKNTENNKEENDYE